MYNRTTSVTLLIQTEITFLSLKHNAKVKYFDRKKILKGNIKFKHFCLPVQKVF